MATLKERQIAAVRQMLNLNQPPRKTQSSEPVWKVLIYDRVGQDIISPLIAIPELRELGITLHIQLHSDRDTVPDAPAIYFCAPTEENLSRIAQDFQNGLYEIYHLNFISPISRQKLEDLASSALQAGCVANIHKVIDQYVNFVTLEDDLFVLKHQQADGLSYYAINRGNTKDFEMEAIMDQICDSLFSVFVTLGNVPIIRAQKNTAAEMVARKLEKKLRENLWDARNNLFHMDAAHAGGAFSFQRPLLIIVDRNLDLATPLHHTWTYQALAHDMLDLSLNRVSVQSDDSGEGNATGAKSKTKTCDLDSRDKFWTSHKGSPFPTVAEAIQEELEQYRSSEDEIKKLKSSMGLTDQENELAYSMVTDTTMKLTNAINSLPQLMEKKRLIDQHTKIATSILNFIKSRRLDSFFELEEKIMSKAALDRPFMDILKDPELGQPEDKMRLFIIYFICTPHVPESECAKYEQTLAEAGCDLSSLPYVKRWKSIMNRNVATESQYEGGGTKTVSMFSKLVSQGSSFVMEGVKNLVVKRHNLPVTKITEQLMECRTGGDLDEYLYLDPKLLRGGDVMPKNRVSFSDAVVFVIGGGNYVEYQNLVDFIKQRQSTNNTKRIIYGTSTFTNAKQFLRQLSLLGQEISDLK